MMEKNVYKAHVWKLSHSDMIDARLWRNNMYVRAHMHMHVRWCVCVSEWMNVCARVFVCVERLTKIFEAPCANYKIMWVSYGYYMFIKLYADIGNDFLHPSDKIHILILSLPCW
jgi:hypothetical protein